MTTTVTVKTHDWPVMVTAANDYAFDDATQAGHGHSILHTFVPKNSEQTFNVTDTQAITVEELDKNASALPGFEPPSDPDQTGAATATVN